MSKFSTSPAAIAKDTNLYLKNFFKNQQKNTNLTENTPRNGKTSNFSKFQNALEMNCVEISGRNF